MKDPRKTEQNQEVMDLYKKNGVNPVGGCLPMPLQLPFLCAFYKVLGVAIEMRGSQLAVDSRSFAAGDSSDSPSAHPAGDHAVRDATDDAQPGNGSGAAENDDVYAADVRFYVLLRIGRIGTILVNRQRGGYRPAVVVEQDYARTCSVHAGSD